MQMYSVVQKVYCVLNYKYVKHTVIYAGLCVSKIKAIFIPLCLSDVGLIDWLQQQFSGQSFVLHGVCMLRECIYGECAHEQHVRRTLTLTLTLTYTITAYSVSGNVVRVRILISATRQKPCRKKVYPILNRLVR